MNGLKWIGLKWMVPNELVSIVCIPNKMYMQHYDHVTSRGVVLKREVWEHRFHKRSFPTPFQKEVWERRAKKEVWEPRSQINKLNKIEKAEPNSSNKVRIRLQEFPHWTFLFHCVNYWLAVQNCVSLAHLWDRSYFNVMFWIPHLEVTLLVQKGVETRSHPNTPMVTS